MSGCPLTPETDLVDAGTQFADGGQIPDAGQQMDTGNVLLDSGTDARIQHPDAGIAGTYEAEVMWSCVVGPGDGKKYPVDLLSPVVPGDGKKSLVTCWVVPGDGKKIPVKQHGCAGKFGRMGDFPERSFLRPNTKYLLKLQDVALRALRLFGQSCNNAGIALKNAMGATDVCFDRQVCLLEIGGWFHV
ncbi:MAG: hypothetical protein GY822_32610 [Deltaproteobacteria bacterium]|nr:hypothetical protein [Deltaproteobacteria bacterium]